MPLNAALFSSKRTDWETPPELFAALDAEFGFTLDVCALPHNAKCVRYFAPEQDGLAQNWQGEVCWMNPPYGAEIGPWVCKAREEADRGGAVVVCLLPARTDTRWFHNYLFGRAEIRFLRSRVKFVGAKHPAPFPCMVCILG